MSIDNGPCVGCGEDTVIVYSSQLANIVLTEVFACSRKCLFEYYTNNPDKLYSKLETALICPIENHIAAECECTHQRAGQTNTRSSLYPNPTKVE